MGLLLVGCCGLEVQATQVGYGVEGGSVGVCKSRWVCAIVEVCLYASFVCVCWFMCRHSYGLVCVWMSV